MRLQGKRILIVSPEDWGPCWVSKHHYAVALARRENHVIFVNRSSEVVSSGGLPDGVEVIPAPRLPKGIRFYPSFFRRLAHRQAFSNLRKLGGDFDLVWSFDGSRYLDLDQDVTGCPSIFYMADFAEGVPWQLPVTSASLCLGVSYGIIEKLKSCGGRTHFIQHGYAHRAGEPYELPTPSPNIVYTGSIAHPIFDVELVMKLARRYEKCHFHFFGDDGSHNLGGGIVSPNRDRLEECTNCFYHPPVSQEFLPGIYSAADALLVPYRVGFDRIGNPHKMMEYLASGTPVISTVLREYRELSDVVLFENNPEAYVERFQSILDGDYSESAAARRAFALDNSYEKQIQRIEAWLAEESGKST